MSLASDVSDWDEGRDPMSARPPAKLRPWERLGRSDRLLLEALADGTWIDERSLRAHLRWPRWRFILITARLILAGWIISRPVDGWGWYGPSQYRLADRAW